MCHVLNISQQTVAFLHGVLICMLFLENWTLLKDLKTTTQPMEILFEQIDSQKKDIAQLRENNHNMGINNQSLEMQVKQMKDKNKITFEDWYRLLQRKQTMKNTEKKKQSLHRSVSWYGAWNIADDCADSQTYKFQSLSSI
jgi:DNA repair ATPase RecN